MLITTEQKYLIAKVSIAVIGYRLEARILLPQIVVLNKTKKKKQKNKQKYLIVFLNFV